MFHKILPLKNRHHPRPLFLRRLRSKLYESNRNKKGLLSKFADNLEKWPLVRIWVRINQSATVVALIVAILAVYFAFNKNTEDRIKYDEDRITKAWDTLTRMSGKNSNGGQISAIQILVKNKIALDKIDLHNTYLAWANLKGASLRGANLQGANLSNVNLHGADLRDANLDGAILYNCDLGGVYFDGASLAKAQLDFSTVDIGIVVSHSLSNTDMTGIKFVLQTPGGDENDESDMDAYGDTVAEAPGSENAQAIINQACANPKYKLPQAHSLPVTPPKRECSISRDYEKIKEK